MTTEIKVPVLPESVADATVATWHVQVGEKFSRDQVLVDIETDKVVLEVPATADGVLTDISQAEGATVLGDQVIGTFSEGAEATASAPAPAESTSVTTGSDAKIIDILVPVLPESVADANVANWQYLVEGANYSGSNCSHTFTSAGIKSVRLIVVNNAGCNDTITKNVIVYPKPIIDFGFTPTILSASSAQACFTNNSSGATSYSWDYGFATSNLFEPCADFPPTVGFFPVKLVGENAFGCKDSLTRFIEYRDIPLVYVPNSFTPNEDGLNDEFTPIVRGVESYSFSVFNRWGELLFETKEIGKGWKGKFNSSEYVMNGIYIYYVRVILPDNSTKEFRGHVQVLK